MDEARYFRRKKKNKKVGIILKMKRLFLTCIFYLIVIKCRAKLNLYTSYKEDLTKDFDYSRFQPFYKVITITSSLFSKYISLSSLEACNGR